MNKKKLIRFFNDLKNLGMNSAKQFGVKGNLAFERMMAGQIPVEEFVAREYFNAR